MTSITTIALDFEGTLISNCMNRTPRPGLCSFLESLRGLVPRIVIMTALDGRVAKDIIYLLADEGAVPSWFGQIECIGVNDSIKDLSVIEGESVERCLLLDDCMSDVSGEQLSQWIEIPCFKSALSNQDAELHRCLEQIRTKVRH